MNNVILEEIDNYFSNVRNLTLLENTVTDGYLCTSFITSTYHKDYGKTFMIPADINDLSTLEYIGYINFFNVSKDAKKYLKFYMKNLFSKLHEEFKDSSNINENNIRFSAYNRIIDNFTYKKDELINVNEDEELYNYRLPFNMVSL
jgi:hypothetical protein